MGLLVPIQSHVRLFMLLAALLVLIPASEANVRPEHWNKPKPRPESTCSALPYAVPLNNGTILAAEGSVAPTFKLGEEFLFPFKFSPLDIGETVAVKAKILDPTANNKEIGFAYWSGVSLGVVGTDNPIGAIVNWQITFAFTQGPAQYSRYGPGLLTAAGVGRNEGSYINLQIVGGGGSFCWVTGGQLFWKKLDPTPGAPGEMSVYLRGGDGPR